MKPKNIILADDEELIIRAARVELGDLARYRLKTFRWGREVLPAARDRGFPADLIVIDIYFDETDKANGEDLYHMIRTEGRVYPNLSSIPVLILTGKIDEEER